MKPKRRITSFLLAICLIIGLLPTAAFAAGTDSGKAIQLGTSGIGDPTKVIDESDSSKIHYTPNSYVYFGVNSGNSSTPIKWRVLDADKANDGTTDGMFLLSEYLLASGVQFNNDYSKGNTYQGSDAQTWCSNFATNTSNFSAAEQAVMLGVGKADGNESDLYSISWGTSSLTATDKLFFLSVRELADYVGNYDEAPGLLATDTAQSAGVWWLRSPDASYDNHAGAVSFVGYVIDLDVFLDWAARPAFNLNLKSVLFTSAAVGGKIPAAGGGGTGGGAADAIFEIGDYSGNEWKLTLKDANRTFSVTENTVTGKPDDTVTLTYSGATVYNETSAPNEYISVIIKDSSGNATHYGRIMQPTAESGMVNITIPSGLAEGTYTLNVFSEQYNGGANDDTKLTDYASAFAAVTLTVDTTPPTLTAGVATRDSETAATVKFNSSEAGTYCYEVVKKDAAAPSNLATDGTSGSCVSGANTISLSTLSGAGAKDIYIVVKDAAGNVSGRLKMEIPEFVPVYSISADTTTLNFGSVQTGYTTPTERTITITNTGNQQITLTQPTSTTGNFTIGALSTTTLAVGATATFTVQPKGSLAAGTYNETITVQGASGSNSTNTISIQANFAVSAPSTGGGGGDTTYYKLTFETNGGSSISAVRGTYGKTIDLTDYTPTRDGYDFNGWYSDKALTQKIAQIKLNGNKTVYAGWTERTPGTDTNPGQDNPNTGAGNPFTDVKETDWFFNDVMFVYEKGLMLGTSGTTFSPNGNTSRAMVATVLWRMAGSPEQEGDAPFTDTKSGAWYNDAIKWAVENDIAGGYGGGLFGPDDNITREQLAAFFYRYAQYKGYDTTQGGMAIREFSDYESISDYAMDAMTWAVNIGLITGRDDGRIDPQANATRAEFAVILHRFIEKYGLEEKTTYTGLTGWVDPNSNYLEVPKTGDSSTSAAVWFALLAASGAGAGYTAHQLRRSKKDKLKPPTPTPA